MGDTSPKTCLVVGASGAIGSATAGWLSTRGWRCIGSSTRSDHSAADIRLDMLEPQMFAASMAHLPVLDGVAICVGLGPEHALDDIEADRVRQMLSVHVEGPLLLIKALEPKLAEGSAIVLVSSVAAYRGSHDPAYAAASGAVIALGRSLARALAPRVRVNILATGLVLGTPVFERMTEDFRSKHLQSTLLDRFATTDDCASAIEFLLSHPHLTGVVLHVNGGQYLG